MTAADQPIFVYTTFASSAEAEALGEALVQRRLAACVNLFPGMVSIYEWQGKLERAGETAMIIKTRSGRQDEVIAELRRLHPYSEPAILVIPLAGGSPTYIEWIHRQTGSLPA